MYHDMIRLARWYLDMIRRRLGKGTGSGTVNGAALSRLPRCPTHPCPSVFLSLSPGTSWAVRFGFDLPASGKVRTFMLQTCLILNSLPFGIR